MRVPPHYLGLRDANPVPSLGKQGTIHTRSSRSVPGYTCAADWTSPYLGDN